ncbi:hypothetical protein J3R83DRAFT_5714 [Lanmaoa asiatica]|nr:hypothetical protein J3R83DRAFT_5714 [Lanmaoa asiatica]
MKRFPDFTNIMTECPLERQFIGSAGEESVRSYASRHAQLSLRGKQILDRLLVLLSTCLKSQPTSRVSPFSPAHLFSICDTLQHGHVDGSAEQNDTSVLPSVLSKLRDWRLLDPDYRYSSGGIHKLALDLAGITDEASASTSSDLVHTSLPRLRIKWVSLDSPCESQGREPSSSTPPSPSSPRSDVLDSAHECAHALPDMSERRSDAVYESCQVGRLGTPNSEDTNAVVSRRHYSVSGFRSGCSACRHPRISGPSAPPSPQMTSLEQRMPFSVVNQLGTNINNTVSSPRHMKPSVQHATTKKTRREKHKSSQSISRGAHINENELPLPTPIAGIGISFPRQRTHSPRISNALLSREPSIPVAASVQRRVEPSHLPNRTREGDKHTSSHRVASVDLRLPIANHFPNHASPIDLHPHAPTRAQSFSYTPVNSHGLGSAAVGVQKLSSNVVGSRLSGRLPFWSQGHLHRRPTMTMTTTSVKPTGSLSPSPAKPSFQNPHPFTRLRPSSGSIPSKIPSDMKRRDPRSVSSRTHKHTQSVGSLPPSPLLHARKWQV